MPRILGPNLSLDDFYGYATENNEGTVSSNGSLRVTTGHRTGRSPKDRFIVNDSETRDTIDWGPINQPIEPAIADALWQKVEAYFDSKGGYVSELQVGSDIKFALPLRVRTETAWQGLFANMIFIRPETFNSANQPIWEVLNCPGFECDPKRDGTNSDGSVILDFTRRRILLAGMRYAGEMKKAMFTTLNYLLPALDVLPMHCGANYKDGKSFLFFGLSGTGKTTLATDPTAKLIGDDEHGWGQGSVFNFEGGCYAKCIDLTEENEPVIFNAIHKPAIMENVILNDRNEPDFSDISLTENTRCCYPLEHVADRVLENRGPEPSAVIFLTCDLYGVMPPVSRLSPQTAAYHFLSGYTASLAGVELGAEISTTFSTCFGAPFFPRPASVYADLLIKRIQASNTPIFLVNTGWSSGGYGEGSRFPIPVTRAIVHAIQSGALDDVETRRIKPLNLDIPVSVPGVDEALLDPGKGWANQDTYRTKVTELVHIFQENFQKYEVEDEIRLAGPG